MVLGNANGLIGIGVGVTDHGGLAESGIVHHGSGTGDGARQGHGRVVSIN